ncbi:hypothetical protein EDB19DRAFT_1394744 [Suillus lakei]|nr:hypothetical protein EDB19DRAFT_1394744 [Suillus lakei]
MIANQGAFLPGSEIKVIKDLCGPTTVVCTCPRLSRSSLLATKAISTTHSLDLLHWLHLTHKMTPPASRFRSLELTCLPLELSGIYLRITLLVLRKDPLTRIDIWGHQVVLPQLHLYRPLVEPAQESVKNPNTPIRSGGVRVAELRRAGVVLRCLSISSCTGNSEWMTGIPTSLCNDLTLCTKGRLCACSGTRALESSIHAGSISGYC